MSTSPQMASRCPLCGGDNQCAIATGEPAQSCWCQAVSISPRARAKAAESAGERCLCPACGATTEENYDER